MSNIFDALEQARRERHQHDPLSNDPVAGFGNSNPQNSGSVSDTATDAEIVSMFVRFQEQLKEGGWIMQLVSSQAGEGVTSVAQRFASVSSASLDKNVLLVRLINRVAEAERELASHLKWQEVLERNAEPSSHQRHGALTEICLLFDFFSKQVKQGSEVLIKLKNNYDIIFFDMPSATSQPYSIELTRYADVVVIVLESEKTKAFALQSLKEKVTNNTDAMIGVVLNKRCFHIPRSLYLRLH